MGLYLLQAAENQVTSAKVIVSYILQCGIALVPFVIGFHIHIIVSSCASGGSRQISGVDRKSAGPTLILQPLGGVVLHPQRLSSNSP